MQLEPAGDAGDLQPKAEIGTRDVGVPRSAAATPGLPGAPAPGVPPQTRAQAAADWAAARVPAPGAPQAIGACSCGCLQGAVALPASGRGYEAIRLGRNRNYGHPDLVAFVRRLGVGAARAKLGPVIVGDLSQPRGGPTRTGHRSHQTGLDADIGYAPPPGLRRGRLSARDRERISPVTVVDLSTRVATPAWGPRVVRLLALAASDPAVDRIFVHATVKKMICEGATAAAPWQARIRPWWGHHDHFHVRLRCPADSLSCVPQEAPADDGCGATLAWWFSDDAEAARAKKQEADAVEATFVLPPACSSLLNDRAAVRTVPKP